MFGADFVLFCISGGILMVRLLWIAGMKTRQSLRRSDKESIIREAVRIVESYEIRPRQ